MHRWGAANRVVFDPGKEEFILLRRRDAIGNDFRLLGVVFDPPDEEWREENCYRSRLAFKGYIESLAVLLDT